MDKRPLGKTGYSIVPLVLGGNVFGWTIDEKTSFDILDAFVDHGFNAIDTADVYSSWVEGNKGGESETIIAALDDVAERHAAKPAEIALAWVMAANGVTAPIASATSRRHVESFAKAAQLTLSADDLAKLDA